MNTTTFLKLIFLKKLLNHISATRHARGIVIRKNNQEGAPRLMLDSLLSIVHLDLPAA